jgi:acyl carrier protein
MTAPTRDAIRDTVVKLLADVAPEADMSTLAPDRRIRDQIDIDSMDALNFLIAVDAALGVDIPESDYPRLATLDSIVDYIEQRLGARA